MALDLLNEPVSKFTNPKMTTISSNLTIQDAAKAMVESKIDSILVFKKNKIIGMVTEKDILYDVVAKGLDPSKTTLKEITKSPIISINKSAPVRKALEIMKKNDIRRLVVMDKRPIGLITQKQVCGNLKQNNILLPELEIADKTFCPYCSAKFKNNKSLCDHIDRVHIAHKNKK
ncbi:MAG TPA: CBS domain-containing protein [Nitrosopumilaceae archaeon]|nr:CBS domain-containing protein [Nitrosopumilaceae archaeon]